MSSWSNKTTRRYTYDSIALLAALLIVSTLFILSENYRQDIDGELTSVSIEYHTTLRNESLIQKNKILKLLEQDYESSSCMQPNNLPDYRLLFNVSQTEPLGNFIPANLVNISGHVPASYDVLCLDKLAAVYLELMIHDAERAGISLMVTSAFRDRGTQAVLYESAVNRHGNNFNGGVTVTPAEHSEHQLGTTIDITTGEIDHLPHNWSFADTDAYEWLKENAHKYGFVMSYPEGQEDITGVAFEPWHWRFVGPDTAQRVRASGMTLTEYLKLEQ